VNVKQNKPDRSPRNSQSAEEKQSPEPKPKKEHRHLSEEEKHKHLLQEKELEIKRREQLKDYRRQFLQKGKHLFDRRRKDKFLGGTKGRRGG
jgi:hypothetical protein